MLGEVVHWRRLAILQPPPILRQTLTMPHPIIEISELTQLLVDHLLLVSRKSIVSLACTCQALEEQALSTLWSEQPSLERLIKSTLPSVFLTDPPIPPVQVRDSDCYLVRI